MFPKDHIYHKPRSHKEDEMLPKLGGRELLIHMSSIIMKKTNLVPEFLDFIFSVFDSTLQSGFGSMLLFLKVLHFLWFKKYKISIQSDVQQLCKNKYITVIFL